MRREKTDKESGVSVDIDVKINSIESSIREIKQLLNGFQASSFRHVNPEVLKGTFQTVLTSLQSPLNQISAFLEEVNQSGGVKVSPRKVSPREASPKEASPREKTPSTSPRPVPDDLAAALNDLDFRSDNLPTPSADLSAALRDLEASSEKDDLAAALADLGHQPDEAPPLESFDLPTGDLSAALRDLEEKSEPEPAFSLPADDLSAALDDLATHGDGDGSFDFGAGSNDLSAALRDLEGSTSENGTSQNDDLSAALRDLDFKGDGEELPSVDGLGLDFSIPTDQGDDLSQALSGLGEASPAALSDLLSSLDAGATPASAKGDADFDLSDLDAAVARLPPAQADFPAFAPPSGKRKKTTNMRPIKMKGGKGLMGLDFGDSEAALAELANVSETTEDPLSASLKELPAATPSWLSMFSAPTPTDEPEVAQQKPTGRRSSRIGRSTPLPVRPEGKLFRDFGVREDINKAGLRRVKKGKGLHATSGKPVLQMEDVHTVVHPFGDDPNKALFAVFDGHVGKNCAIAAKNLFPTEFLNQLSASNSEFDATEAFKASYEIVDKQLAEYEYEGTTATTVYMWQVGETRYIQAANLGDSTAFLCRDGEAIWLTKDHKVSDPDEQERLKQLGPGAWHPGKSRINGLAVSRAMGDFFVKNEGLGLIGEPFISEVYELTPQDSILIVASDGLWDVISGQGAMNLIIHMDDAQEMAKALIRHALNSPKCNDNITIIVVTL